MSDNYLREAIQPQLEVLIRELWPRGEIQSHVAAGGFLLEVVDASITSESKQNDHRRVLERVQRYNLEQGRLRKDVIVFHRVYLYAASGDQFKVHGTLHTRPCSYDDSGILTTYLEADDAYVWIAEVDMQTMLHGGIVPNGLRMVSEATASGFFMLKDELKLSYLQLESEGGFYGIRSIDRSRPGSDVWIAVVTDEEEHSTAIF